MALRVDGAGFAGSQGRDAQTRGGHLADSSQRCARSQGAEKRLQAEFIPTLQRKKTFIFLKTKEQKTAELHLVLRYILS